MSSNNGDVLQGKWMNKELEGCCVATYANGSSYFGSFKTLKFEGEGCFSQKNGDEFVGGWVDN